MTERLYWSNPWDVKVERRNKATKIKDPSYIRDIRSIPRKRRTDEQQRILIEYLKKKARGVAVIGNTKIRRETLPWGKNQRRYKGKKNNIFDFLGNVFWWVDQRYYKPSKEENIEYNSYREDIDKYRKIKRIPTEDGYTIEEDLWLDDDPKIYKSLKSVWAREIEFFMNAFNISDTGDVYDVLWNIQWWESPDYVIWHKTLESIYLNYYFWDYELPNKELDKRFKEFKKDIDSVIFNENRGYKEVYDKYFLWKEFSSELLVMSKYLNYRQLSEGYSPKRLADMKKKAKLDRIIWYNPKKVFNRKKSYWELWWITREWNSFYSEKQDKRQEYIRFEWVAIIDTRISWNIPMELSYFNYDKESFPDKEWEASYTLKDNNGRDVVLYYKNSKLRLAFFESTGKPDESREWVGSFSPRKSKTGSRRKIWHFYVETKDWEKIFWPMALSVWTDKKWIKQHIWSKTTGDPESHGCFRRGNFFQNIYFNEVWANVPIRYYPERRFDDKVRLTWKTSRLDY